MSSDEVAQDRSRHSVRQSIKDICASNCDLTICNWYFRNKEVRYGDEYQRSFIQHEEYFISLAKHQAEQATTATVPVTEL